jgi:hypothetical protein
MVYSDEWLLQHGLLGDYYSDSASSFGGDKYRGAAVAELNLPTPKTILQTTTLSEALDTMTTEDFDVLPGAHIS